jgi:uncharacterized protein YjbI with pentapeptide repeats
MQIREATREMERPGAWLAVPAAAVFLVLSASVLFLPRVLYPPLSSAELRGVPTAKERIELQQAQSGLQNDARATLLQAAGGVLLVAAAVTTWRQVHVAREGQITERFTRAIDQLGSDKLEIRLGGILALERVARNSEADREAITRILEIFVRTHTRLSAATPESREPHPHPPIDKQLPWLRDRDPDVAICLIVLGRRLPSRADKAAHLPRVDLRRAYLSEGRFPGATLTFANLERAEMRMTHLEGSHVAYADLRKVDARRGFFMRSDLHRAWLDQADLSGADLRETNLAETCLWETDLRGADLRYATLSNADLRGAKLSGARLEGADLTGLRENAATTWPTGFDADRRRHAGIVAEEGPAKTGPTASAS